MSKTLTTAPAVNSTSDGGTLQRWSRPALILVALIVLAALPLYLDAQMLKIGSWSMAAAVGAIGLTLLVGTAGQLSLAHAFFAAVGAYGYAYLASPSDGLGWPPVFAALGGIALAATAGLAFSPVAARVRGLYLGVASLGLVFIGQHLLKNLGEITGGVNGRGVPPFSVLGFELTGNQPALSVLGVAFGAQERIWYLALFSLLVAIYLSRGIINRRPGRAFTMVRDNQAAASALGIDVQRYKASAFVISSAFAGGAGVLTGLAYAYLTPQNFGLPLSINFLVMVLIGGLGSVGGAVVGAIIVTATPLLLANLAANTGILAAGGSGGYDAGTVSSIVFGVLVVALIILEPGGLARLGSRLWSGISARLGATTRKTSRKETL
ncbi:branched-chain amino acid ABC transporter permease [Leucobacter sp. USHLN153]|uniref:branched-chain amino acid ABC transporter permease n=1 Tax=Leucobacter sp. USHLN153 TaxID=3081268 RepID=UPI00301AF96F